MIGIIFHSSADTFMLTHPFLHGTRPHPVCSHTHTHSHSQKEKNFVLLFWPPPLLVFILICMRGVQRGVSRAHWSCASSLKHTHEHVKLQGHTSSMVQNEEQGNVEVGRISILNEAMVEGKKKGLTSRTPRLPKTGSKIKEQSRNKCTIVSDVC